MDNVSLKDRRVLYISYNGLLDPLGQSQVIPYLRELSGEGVRFTLLSFERARAFEPDGLELCNKLERKLADYQIEWHRLRYHRRPSLPATVYDILVGISCAQSLVRRNGIEMVHARSTVPAVIALALKKLFGIKMIFDVRGLLADEYVDAGYWRKEGIKYRLTKALELRCLAASDGVVTLTERIWPIIERWPELRTRGVAHQVIPCCVDLDRFKFDPTARNQRRAELRLEDRLVLVYSGSIGGWYLTEEMIGFFVAMLSKRPNVHLLCLITNGQDKVEAILKERGVAPGSYTIKSVSSEDVSSYLSASDAGIAFIKPCFSKLASSPTKNAEYLACGLPLVINSGIGDSDSLVRTEGIGALVSDFTQREYEAAETTIVGMLEDPHQARRRSRNVAERHFDVRRIGLERYASLYDEVLFGTPPHSQTTKGTAVLTREVKPRI
jgi:glycosyltransferase involved in cell wall biosynthesis